MSNTYRIKSRFLNVINECIKKISIVEDDSSFTQPSIDSDGNFYTDIKAKSEPKISNSAEISKLGEENKEDLVAKAVAKLRQSIDIASDLDDIINEIIGYDNKQSNSWILNKDHCDLYLAKKNAHIFKQNNNLCLSHNGKIEIFKSVEEMKKYLKDNDFPDVPAVKLYESTK